VCPSINIPFPIKTNETFPKARHKMTKSNSFFDVKKNQNLKSLKDFEWNIVTRPILDKKLDAVMIE